MEIARLDNSKMTGAYGIFCHAIAKRGDRDSLYPTFCEIPPKGKTTTHNHFEAELFFIVSGHGSMTIGIESNEVQAHDLIRIPPFARHELSNLGDEKLVFLSVYGEDFETLKPPAKALITAAPPTPNGALHLGHISGPYLAADIAARHLRQRNAAVRLHSGTDDHQNYVAAKAISLQEDPESFRSRMRARIQKGLMTAEIAFDEFIEPKKDANYQMNVQSFAERVFASGILETSNVELPYCPACDVTLIDSLIDGTCPCCQEPSRGGCEGCGIVVPPQDLLNIHCGRCGKPASRKSVLASFFPLSHYLPLIQDNLKKLSLSSHLLGMIARMAEMKDLKVLVAHQETNERFKSGLSSDDSELTLHVWFEMAAHYEQFALSTDFWIHSFGFDNGFYYLLFIPALLRALNANAKLPDALITNEFLLLEGKKFSTSRGHAIWADEFTGSADHLRLFLSLNRPANLTSDFSMGRFSLFSADLKEQLDQLTLHAQSLETRVKIPKALYSSEVFLLNAIVHSNRFTREMERDLAPSTFAPRQAARRLLDFIDLTIQSSGLGERGEYIMLRSIGTAMASLMPKESEKILALLGTDSNQWIADWAVVV